MGPHLSLFFAYCKRFRTEQSAETAANCISMATHPLGDKFTAGPSGPATERHSDRSTYEFNQLASI